MNNFKVMKLKIHADRNGATLLNLSNVLTQLITTYCNTTICYRFLVLIET